MAALVFAGAVQTGRSLAPPTMPRPMNSRHQLPLANIGAAA